MPGRRRAPSASSTTPASLTRSVKFTRALQPWTGWSRSRSAESPSLRPRPRPSGETRASTSSTPPAPSTSRSKWSARRPSWTGRSRCAGPAAAAARAAGPRSETVWRQADKYGVPRIAFINKMDRIGANFDSVVGQIRTKLGKNAVPLQIPIGAEDKFKGVIDLVSMKALVFKDETLGAKYDVEEIPAELREEAERFRAKLVESIAESHDELLEKYLSGETLE